MKCKNVLEEMIDEGKGPEDKMTWSPRTELNNKDTKRTKKTEKTGGERHSGRPGF